MTVNGRTPILVGCAQYLQKGDPAVAKGPKDLLADVAARAAADAGDEAAVLAAIDTLTVVQSTTAESGFKAFPVGHLNDPPRTISSVLGISPEHQLSTSTGGNTPQMLVNRFAEDIAEGRRDAVLLVGGEVLHSMFKRIRAGEDMTHWSDDRDPIPADRILGCDDPGTNEIEKAHGLDFPTNVYPMFENALRAHYGRSIEEHQKMLGELLAPFSDVAAKNTNAWFSTSHRADEISIEGPANRLVGFPYTKFMNSIMLVDQGAAVVLMSVEKAEALGIDPAKWVFLHGCADVYEIWNVLDRIDYHSSPAIRLMGQKALVMAGWTVEEVDYIDLYSCFPAVVEIACDELGIPHDDPRRLTVTGGLPYFGGPGNAYVMCSIAEMMKKVRQNPGSKGLVTANGWFVTKHSMGLYSTDPIEGGWQRESPREYQKIIDAMDHPTHFAQANGRGTIETYTVVHARDKVRMGIVIGRLEDGVRFVAHVPHNQDLLEQMKREDFIGRSGVVTAGDPINTFVPDAN